MCIVSAWLLGRSSRGRPSIMTPCVELTPVGTANLKSAVKDHGTGAAMPQRDSRNHGINWQRCQLVVWTLWVLPFADQVCVKLHLHSDNKVCLNVGLEEVTMRHNTMKSTLFKKSWKRYVKIFGNDFCSKTFLLSYSDQKPSWLIWGVHQFVYNTICIWYYLKIHLF